MTNFFCIIAKPAHSQFIRLSVKVQKKMYFFLSFKSHFQMKIKKKKNCKKASPLLEGNESD